jgi:hypothetical protein
MPRPARRARSVPDPTSGREAVKAVRDLRLWRRRLEGVLGFLEELQAGPTKVNAHWRRQMREHYLPIVVQMLEHVPLGGEGSAVSFRARLKALLADG